MSIKSQIAYITNSKQQVYKSAIGLSASAPVLYNTTMYNIEFSYNSDKPVEQAEGIA